jgi:hypothetical protein
MQYPRPCLWPFDDVIKGVFRDVQRESKHSRQSASKPDHFCLICTQPLFEFRQLRGPKIGFWNRGIRIFGVIGGIVVPVIRLVQISIKVSFSMANLAMFKTNHAASSH